MTTGSRRTGLQETKRVGSAPPNFRSPRASSAPKNCHWAQL